VNLQPRYRYAINLQDLSWRRRSLGARGKLLACYKSRDSEKGFVKWRRLRHVT